MVMIIVNGFLHMVLIKHCFIMVTFGLLIGMGMEP